MYEADDSHGAPVLARAGDRAGPGGCTSEGTTAPPSAELSRTVLEAMTDGLQDEYRAAAVYEGVLSQFGQVLPFRDILQAEQKHAASIAALFTVRGLVVPARINVEALSRSPR